MTHQLLTHGVAVFAGLAAGLSPFLYKWIWPLLTAVISAIFGREKAPKTNGNGKVSNTEIKKLLKECPKTHADLGIQLSEIKGDVKGIHDSLSSGNKRFDGLEQFTKDMSKYAGETHGMVSALLIKNGIHYDPPEKK